MRKMHFLFIIFFCFSTFPFLGLCQENMGFDPYIQEPTTGEFPTGDYEDLFKFEKEYKKLMDLRIKICGNLPNLKLEGEYWFFHKESGKCWPLNEKGPCPQDMIIHPSDPINGTCDCKDPVPENRIYIYHPKSDRCYLSLTQGPCPSRHMLTLDEDNQPKCVFNSCWRWQRQGRPLMVLFQGWCYPIGKNCDEIGNGQLFGSLQISSKLKPFCQSSFAGAISVVAAPVCRRGSKISISGKCQILHDF